MIAFIIRRLLGALLVMFTLSVLVFLIFFATPSVDPASQIAGRNASPQTLKQVRHDFGLDRPLPVQYVIMMKKLFWSRDLASFTNRGAKILPQIEAATPVTLSLVIGAAIIWVFFAIVATVLCLNVLGDGIRDALDPRARLRFGRQAADK